MYISLEIQNENFFRNLWFTRKHCKIIVASISIKESTEDVCNKRINMIKEFIYYYIHMRAIFVKFWEISLINFDQVKQGCNEVETQNSRTRLTCPLCYHDNVIICTRYICARYQWCTYYLMRRIILAFAEWSGGVLQSHHKTTGWWWRTTGECTDFPIHGFFSSFIGMLRH